MSRSKSMQNSCEMLQRTKDRWHWSARQYGNDVREWTSVGCLIARVGQRVRIDSTNLNKPIANEQFEHWKFSTKSNRNVNITGRVSGVLRSETRYSIQGELASKSLQSIHTVYTERFSNSFCSPADMFVAVKHVRRASRNVWSVVKRCRLVRKSTNASCARTNGRAFSSNRAGTWWPAKIARPLWRSAFNVARKSKKWSRWLFAAAAKALLQR